MKFRMLFAFLLICNCIYGCGSADGEPIRDYQVLLTALEENGGTPDSLLINVQDKIYNAFVQSFMAKTPEGLTKIEQQLSKLGENNNNNIIHYWRAYAAYYRAIYYIKSGDRETSQKATEKGIAIIEDLKKKSSEDYALLAMLQSFSIQFHSGIEAPFISNKVKSNAEKASELDPKNLRAYFVMGSSDYYTPEQYGGGTKVEEYLTKAISLEAQNLKNPYLPSWGKDTSYELLIRFYIKKERFDDAKKYFKEAIELYPDSYMLNQLGKRLIDK